MRVPTDPLHQALGHTASDKRLDILRRIGEVGSISQAARDAGVSYKAAWQAVDTLSNLAGSPLLEKVVGGSGGGGARLTATGHKLLAAAERLHTARNAAVAQLDAVPAFGAGALALRTSMRNTLPCTVHRVQAQAGAMNVQLRLPDGQMVTARITRESSQLLGLTKGLNVLALCKATAVKISAMVQDTLNQDTNWLHGTASRLPAAGRAGEVRLQLGADLHLVGFADAGHGLRQGDAAMARFEWAALVMGLRD
ncbi:molybdenum-dependent transcriptional regulator [Limnohabitans sp. DCL3]|uniref:molybdenum-dependent transcriptional regulator n=1 Tax=Limnohabitans sp. DCL3 TaxID=3374103 RepID=UPI003A8BE579